MIFFPAYPNIHLLYHSPNTCHSHCAPRSSETRTFTQSTPSFLSLHAKPSHILSRLLLACLRSSHGPSHSTFLSQTDSIYMIVFARNSLSRPAGSLYIEGVDVFALFRCLMSEVVLYPDVGEEFVPIGTLQASVGGVSDV